MRSLLVAPLLTVAISCEREKPENEPVVARFSPQELQADLEKFAEAARKVIPVGWLVRIVGGFTSADTDRDVQIVIESQRERMSKNTKLVRAFGSERSATH